MKSRKALIALGTLMILGAPLSAVADGTWIRSNDEAGWQYVPAPYGSAKASPALPAVKPLQIGDLSTDREWVYTGGESDWAPRQMTYVYQGGRLVHLDDPVGHMNRLPDSRPLTDNERLALESSGGG